jgi:2-dehydro-3-deoxyphosphooctonate aldolase (KDO 8-P synthase)
MTETVQINGITAGGKNPLFLVAGPCVIEEEETTFAIAAFLKQLTDKLDIPFIFKASYDKANRTSIDSYRGPGIKDGLAVLKRIKTELNVPILSDVHTVEDIEMAATVLDIIQIPAFLCRQTDFVMAVAGTGQVVNIKKGQFLAPWDVANIVKKVTSVGNHRVLLTERGAMFGYNNLVVDFRGISIMQETTGCPVIFDATHSVQLPGGSGTSSSGQREYAPVLAKAAVAAGADGVFMEVHSNPEEALCDGPNSLYLDTLEDLLTTLKAIKSVI